MLYANCHLGRPALQSPYYTAKQLQGALGSAFGLDTKLIMDNTYFVATMEKAIVGCGGWSKRQNLFGGDGIHKNDSLLDPSKDSARIRAFFIDPAYARRGIGTLLLRACELEAAAHDFSKLELVATLAGVPLYMRYGFGKVEDFVFSLPNGEILLMVRMNKNIALQA